jgi:hypothetical protein
MDRRVQLLTWIEETKRNQRRIAIACAVLAIASIIAGAVKDAFGTIGFVVTVSFAVIGFWVTSSHIADWNHQLDQLRQRKNRA